MAIELTTLTSTQKSAVLGALGLNETITRTAPENLSNKTLISPTFNGECNGQLELTQQVSLTQHSVINRSTIRRELMMQESTVQRFNTTRTWNVRGGTSALTIGNSGDDIWMDTRTRAILNTGSDDGSGKLCNHTSWARKEFGTCYLNSASGGALDWNNPFSIALKLNNCEQVTGSTSEYWAGISNNWNGGLPCGRGIGIICDINGFRLWFQDGTISVICDTSGLMTITTGTSHGFTVGDRVRFTAAQAGSGVLTTTTYFICETPSNTTFRISEISATGTVFIPSIAILTNTQVAKKPIFSPIFATASLQTNVNILISSDGLGTASLYYGIAGNTILSNTPTTTLAVASTGGGTPVMTQTCTFSGSMGSVTGNTAMAVITASFAPFAG